MKYIKDDSFFLKLVKNGKLKVEEDGKVTNIETGKVIGQKTPIIILKENDSRYAIPTYTLVWIAFNGLVPEGLRVFRKNSKGTCALNNLELDTLSERNKKIGTSKRFKSRPGSSNGAARFTDEQVLALREEYHRKPFSIRKRAKEIGTSHPILAMALKGKSYAYLPNAVKEFSKNFSGSRKSTPRAKKPKEVKPVMFEKPKIIEPKLKVVKPKIVTPKIVPSKPKIVKPIITKPTIVKQDTSSNRVDFDEEAKANRLEMLKRLGARMRL